MKVFHCYMKLAKNSVYGVNFFGLESMPSNYIKTPLTGLLAKPQKDLSPSSSNGIVLFTKKPFLYTSSRFKMPRFEIHILSERVLLSAWYHLLPIVLGRSSGFEMCRDSVHIEEPRGVQRVAQNWTREIRER